MLLLDNTLPWLDLDVTSCLHNIERSISPETESGDVGPIRACAAVALFALQPDSHMCSLPPKPHLQLPTAPNSSAWRAAVAVGLQWAVVPVG